MNTNNRVKISGLEKRALELSQEILDTQQIMRTNLTKEFYEELRKIVKARELINIQVIGKVTTGKSTVALEIARTVNEKLLKKKMGMNMVCPDQLEYSRKVMNGDLRDIMLQTDEWNSLSETGENATTETAFLQHFSDVMAQKYIHRVSCSPEGITDHNANIILETLAPDKKNKITTCLLYMRVIKPTGTIIQLVGHVRIGVGQTINKNWYKKYRQKKFDKMDLVQKEGVKDVREMEQADLIMNIYKRLGKMAGLGLVNREIIRNFIEIERRKNKRFFSILGTNMLETKLDGLLTMEKQANKLYQKIQKEKNQFKKEKDIYKKKLLLENIVEEEAVLKDIRSGIGEILEEYHRLIKIDKKYRLI